MLYFAKVKPEARVPQRRPEDAGYDFYACFDEEALLIGPQETKMVPLGIASAFEPGWVMILKERGSTGTKGIAQRSGVIDSGYRGEYLAPLTNLNPRTLVIAKHPEDWDPEKYLVYPYDKAVCQGVLLQIPEHESAEVSYEELQKMASQRGAGRLGSSGK